MAEPLLLGVDIGTTQTKVGLYDLAGRRVGAGAAGYPLHVDGAGAEQDPDDWWRALAAATRSTLAGIDLAGLAAVAIGGQGPTLVPVDAEMRPVGRAISWLDTRAAAEASELSALLQDGGALNRSGPSNYAKALWLKRNRPETYDRTRWLLCCWDAALGRLTGQAVTSLKLNEAAIEAAGIERNRFPGHYVEFGGLVGPARAEPAAELGLPRGLPVVAGWVDAFQGVLGSGAVWPGQLCLNGGTSGGVSAIAPADHPTGFPFLGGKLLGGPTSTSGKAVEWVRDLVRPGSSIAEAVDLAAGVPPGADGVVFLPYLMGERAPINDPHVRGLFFGLSLAHGPAHLLRAAIEGTVFSMRHVLETTGLQPSEARAIGGQARSPLWNQIKADVLGLPVLVPAHAEAGTLGAAMIAAKGIGLAESPMAAADRMVTIAARHVPDPATRGLYDRRYALYRQLYPRVADLPSD